MAATASAADRRPWFLRSTYPVDFPAHDALTKSRADFDGFLADQLIRRRPDHACAETPTLGGDSASIEAKVRDDLAVMDLDGATQAGDEAVGNMDTDPKTWGPFMQGLVNHHRHQPAPPGLPANKMLTENADVALRSSTNPLVDLFAELEDVVSGPRLRQLLDAAWAEDPSATLKLIFNARSIHLGKGSRGSFYRAAGWLAQNHPLTLVANLGWLSRPVIEKKAGTAAGEADEDVVLVEGPRSDEEDGWTRLDVKHGVAHGYWKDLLNILVLAVRGKLDVLADPRDVLNAEDEIISRVMRNRCARRSGRVPPRPPANGYRSRGRPTRTGAENPADEAVPAAHTEARKDGSAGEGKTEKAKPDIKQRRNEARKRRHATAVDAFSNNVVYRALHLAVARLFAQQLRADLQALGDEHPGTRRRGVSLCGKWAPSQDHFHDRHTSIASSIAELLHPRESLTAQDAGLAPDAGRETFLRHARERYRRDLSALRAHLGVVERDVTAGTFDRIRYERVPSLAMSAHCGVFIAKDAERFEAYVERVARGKAGISGATLLPSTLVSRMRLCSGGEPRPSSRQALVRRRVCELEARVADGQWRTLVRRIRDSGTLASSIAVCDVSGSMEGPRFPDGSCPMDSALGLSLLVAEVTEPPFGGAFITFSASPTVQKIDLTQGLGEKLRGMQASEWGLNTDFVKVFEELILPMAVENKLPPEDMVRRVFVFSDMHFDGAQETWSLDGSQDRRDKQPEKWSSSYERIKRNFAGAGYDMPELVFWNLAGGRAGSGAGEAGGDATAPKPIAATEEGTSLVSGYSQGMLKVFLDNGSFQDPEEEEEDQPEESDDEMTKRKIRKDPLRTVKRAIGHEAYAMLRVMD
ncbi:hypothetical protein HRG_005274 [Hirsutella rhossiliensis]|uniref:DUF2828 domain-containing protein n=1 Tax=Hirsutella rhossiliensis TaxID=111463 RepID=A0A9P8SI27_9HYPO|nr:uncharacterized protein HRG_05274 [Hirsutella rhossiliensis]KAH0962764.1 hypothetical protein HRG_05274 [Hirsutella rhossiliensis]